MRTRASKTGTGSTEGKAEGGRFLEDQSNADMTCWIHSRLSFPSEGQDRGTGAAGGGGEGDGERLSQEVGVVVVEEEASASLEVGLVMVLEMFSEDIKSRVSFFPFFSKNL